MASLWFFVTLSFGTFASILFIYQLGAHLDTDYFTSISEKAT
jgi:hypothetical protein